MDAVGKAIRESQSGLGQPSRDWQEISRIVYFSGKPSGIGRFLVVVPTQTMQGRDVRQAARGAFFKGSFGLFKLVPGVNKT